MPIFIVRTTAGREHQVADRILILAEREKGIVKSIMHPDLRGYLFVEADNRDEVVQFVYGMHNVKGVIAEPVLMEKLKHFFAVETKEIVVKEGDIVELISTPFKGEKAKITRVDEVKSEITVELLEVAIPIPVTIPMVSVRLHKKKEL